MLIVLSAIGPWSHSQTPIPNVLSADLGTAGFLRTGNSGCYGPTPPGGAGSIPSNDPGHTRELLQFGRGVIPAASATVNPQCFGFQNINNQGGPSFNNCVGVKLEHIQDVQPIGDWSTGSGYLFVTHNQDNFGHLFVLKTNNVVGAPNDQELYGLPGVDGQGVWYRRLFAPPCSQEGSYNHPGDIALVGNIIVVAAQNWNGNACTTNIWSPATPDAVLFYDVSDPENPVYLGKIPISAVAPQLSELSNLTAGKIDNYYYMRLGDGNSAQWLYSTTMSPQASTWLPLAAFIDLGGPGVDTIISMQEEGTTSPSSWALNLNPGPILDPYERIRATRITSSAGGSILTQGPETREYVLPSLTSIAPGLAERGIYVSPRGRMSRVVIDGGFTSSGDTCIVEIASMHFLQDVVFPPTSPILPLGDFYGWSLPQYFSTIQAADIDGDGTEEILGRAASGLLAWKNVNGTWIQILGSIPLTDASGWSAPQYYSTIQTADLDGNGKAEIIARSSSGVQAWSHYFTGFQPVPGTIPLTDASGFALTQYYSTIQSADIDGDGRDEILARDAFGVKAWSHNGQAWVQRNGIIPLSDASGWSLEPYYSTIGTGDFDGNGTAEVYARSGAGVMVWTRVNDNWVQLQNALLPLTDIAGFGVPAYYRTIQAADINGDGADELLARGSLGMFAYSLLTGSWTTLPGSIPFSDASFFLDPSLFLTIQTADLDGDGAKEVIARDFTFGLSAYSFSGSSWVGLGSTIQILSYPSAYNAPQYYFTIQTADVDGDRRADILARLIWGLYRWEPSALGASWRDAAGVNRFGTSSPDCLGYQPTIRIAGPARSGNSSFAVITTGTPALSPGLLGFSSASAPGTNINGIQLWIDLNGALVIPVNSDYLGNSVLSLPLPPGLTGATVYAMSVWFDAGCPTQNLSATDGIQVTLF